MGIRSTSNWSGTVIAGCLLGVPKPYGAADANGVIANPTLYEWDGGVPNGVVDDNGVFTPDGNDPQTGQPAKTPMAALPGATFKPWQQPTGAHDAYPVKTVVEYQGARWVNLTPANVQRPGVSGWRQFSENTSTIFAWVQPTGAHDAYKLNAEVTFGGKTWKNTGSDANVWQPGVFGWVVV
jgi:hypothetical protein